MSCKISAFTNFKVKVANYDQQMHKNMVLLGQMNEVTNVSRHISESQLPIISQNVSCKYIFLWYFKTSTLNIKNRKQKLYII
jgi:hypothetical protein